MGSVLRHICPVLAIAVAAGAMDIASAQQIGSASPDIRTGIYRGRSVTYEIIDGLAVWDGDIILGTPEELDEPRSVFAAPGKAIDIRRLMVPSSVVVRSKERGWPGGIIPYVIDPELINPHVPDAIQHWNENTVIRLVERTDQPNWVRFVPTDSGPCRATLGMVGGEQKIWLKEFCGVGAVVHEIGHAVGLGHEQQRNDRGLHVWVSWRPGERPFIIPLEQSGGRELDIGPYDYGSVMHYSWTGSLRTIPPGIVLGEGGLRIGKGSGRGLSAGDIDGVSRLYGEIPTRTTVTTNPAGLTIEVDREAYIAPHSFDWAPGTRHTIGVSSPQVDVYNHYYGKSRSSDLHRYLFAKWSDGGSQSHFITSSSETTVFIANFIKQIRPKPRAHPPQGGTVRLDPPSADGFYTVRSFVKSIAEPAEGFSFERWKSIGFLWPPAGRSANPARSRIGQHHSAFFTSKPLTTLDTNAPGALIMVDGSQTKLPANFAWEAGSTHTLDMLIIEGGCCTFDEECCSGAVHYGGGYRLIFNGWSDGGGYPHEISVSGEPTRITANFTRQVFLETKERGAGKIVVEPEPPVTNDYGSTYYNLSSSVRLTAEPRPGFEFITWIGDLSGNENPQSLVMDSYKWVRAFFIDLQSFESARLISGKPVEWLSGPGLRHSLGYNGYWINVPRGATQLAIHLVTATQGADVDLYANRKDYPYRIPGENNEEIIGYASQYLSTGPGGNESITITPESSPPLEPGLYFIAINVRTAGVRVKGTLTAEVNISESAISANVPHFGFPASLFTKTVKHENPPPQALEIRNSGEGTLDYQITTDQSWLSVSPNHGSSTGETDTVLITVDPVNLGAGAFEGVITIAAPPAWPVKVPITLIVTRDQGEFPLLYFAHFANGAGIKSDLVFVNVGTHPIRPALDFYDKEGHPMDPESVVDVTGDLEVQEDGSLSIQTAMEPLGELTISTHGQGEVVSGSVKVLSDGPIGGVLRFNLPNIGVAGVGASQPTRDAIFPVRRQAGGINTAVAIHNPGERAIEVRCELWFPRGFIGVNIHLGANGQDSRFIDEMFTLTDTDFAGSVRCRSSTGLFTGVAVELDAANRIFTTLPVVPVDPRDGGGETVLDFAHFANGAGIKSELVFVNAETQQSGPAIRPAIYFYDKGGNPIAAESVVEVTGRLEVQEDGSLSVRRRGWSNSKQLTISTHGQGEVVSGSVKVLSDGPIGGVLRFNLPNIGVAGVGASQPTRDALFPVRRQAGGIGTAAALHNLEADAQVVLCQLMKEGAVLEEIGIPLEANGQDARFIEEVFPRTDTSDFVGSVRCTAPEGGRFTGVAVELDAGNRIFTTLPVVPVPEMPSQE